MYLIHTSSLHIMILSPNNPIHQALHHSFQGTFNKLAAGGQNLELVVDSRNPNFNSHKSTKIPTVEVIIHSKSKLIK